MKNGKLIIGLLLMMCLVAGLSGCSSNRGEGGGDEVIPLKAEVIEFRLGEGTMQERSGEVTFPLDGLLGVPEGEDRPVVFVLHGAHAPQDVTEDRFYQGFSGLAAELAQQGYVVMAINSNRAFSLEPFEGNEHERAEAIFRAYYDLLQRANQGEAIFEADITGKADMTRLNFIGHSKGGDNSLYITNQLQAEGNDAVQSVLTVASPLSVEDEILRTDVPTGVILSQYDGEVTDLASAVAFNRAWFLDDARRSPVTMAFVNGANHGRYNSVIPQEDFLAPPQNVVYLSGETQRAFLNQYAKDFLAAFNQGQQDIQMLLGEAAPKRYGIDFIPSVFVPGAIVQLPVVHQGDLVSDSMETKTAIMSVIPMENTIAPFNPPGVLRENVALYKFRWDEVGQQMVIKVEDGAWAQKKYLSLLWACDSAEMANEETAAIALEVIVTDQAGNDAGVSLDGQTVAALRKYPVTVENIFEGIDTLPAYYLANTHTPLSVSSILLDDFAGVNMNEIASVTIRSSSKVGAGVFGGLRVHE